ncbi:hypothetical protein CHARACLAT_024186 [Characodon lateralis]|uniref:Uncharacterized protein n=1 Tax=Characodon lateralis TaxID=208331 RepID=A0ABU7DCI8_9TELE|nr:hypothetical protein [Characodon lateralis]
MYHGQLNFLPGCRRAYCQNTQPHARFLLSHTLLYGPRLTAQQRQGGGSGFGDASAGIEKLDGADYKAMPE